MRPVTNYSWCYDIVANASCHLQESCGKQYCDPHSAPAPATFHKIITFTCYLNELQMKNIYFSVEENSPP